jgi:hypothetical protein
MLEEHKKALPDFQTTVDIKGIAVIWYAIRFII